MRAIFLAFVLLALVLVFPEVIGLLLLCLLVVIVAKPSSLAAWRAQAIARLSSRLAPCAA